MTADAKEFGPFELRKMRIDAGQPLRYFLALGPATDDSADSSNSFDQEELELSALLGSSLELIHTGSLRCQACGNHTRKSYAQGHCYPCFKRLARCDLCVMAPNRCHYDKGTCREPEWGESFCMQPHLVYLANSSGLKVGITRDGQQLGRWRDQGALQGRILARTSTRQAAGLLEAELAKTFGDRSQWRTLLSGDAPLIDLDAAAAEARQLVPDPGPKVEYVTSDDPAAVTEVLSYPVQQWPDIKRLNFKKADRVGGVLIGIKAQYLLFDTGVFNVREHTGFEVLLRQQAGTPVPVADSAPQIDLF